MYVCIYLYDTRTHANTEGKGEGERKRKRKRARRQLPQPQRQGASAELMHLWLRPVAEVGGGGGGGGAIFFPRTCHAREAANARCAATARREEQKNARPSRDAGGGRGGSMHVHICIHSSMPSCRSCNSARQASERPHVFQKDETLDPRPACCRWVMFSGLMLSGGLQLAVDTTQAS